jgi:hypothetical protein
VPVIEFSTDIHAPIERVFDLSRSVDLHMASTAQTRERAITGVTSGLMTLGQEVTWRAKHFGSWQHLTSRITAFERPTISSRRDAMSLSCATYSPSNHRLVFSVASLTAFFSSAT